MNERLIALVSDNALISARAFNNKVIWTIDNIGKDYNSEHP